MLSASAYLRDLQYSPIANLLKPYWKFPLLQTVPWHRAKHFRDITAFKIRLRPGSGPCGTPSPFCWKCLCPLVGCRMDFSGCSVSDRKRNNFKHSESIELWRQSAMARVWLPLRTCTRDYISYYFRLSACYHGRCACSYISNITIIINFYIYFLNYLSTHFLLMSRMQLRINNIEIKHLCTNFKVF